MNAPVLNSKRKVLVQAYACAPGEGSEPGVGWNMCQAIATHNETWVVTRCNNREAIQQALERHPNQNLHFVYTDLPKWLSFWKKGGRGIRTYYYLWQFAAWLKARSLIKQHDFSLAHHITFVNDWLFSSFSLLPVPFIWGPIGSHPRAPISLSDSRKTNIKDGMRYGFQACMRVVDPLFWICTLRARLIIGINKEVGEKFPISFIARNKYINHTAIGVENTFHPGKKTGHNILSIGRLVPIKAFHLTIDAFCQAQKKNPELQLTIIGKGPLRQDLIEQCRTLCIESSVDFVDWMPRDQVLQTMKDADLFLFPSFEGGGMVILEAMANGLPVVCLKYGGPGEMANPETCGIVPVSDYKSTKNALADAIVQRVESSHEQQENTLRWIRENYLWSERHKTIAKWYQSVLKPVKSFSS